MTVSGFVAGVALLVCALAPAPPARARQLTEARAELNEEGRWVNGVTESWWTGYGIKAEDMSGAAARWKEVGDELARAGAEGLAGDYFRGGDTSGTYMRWSPGAGFVIAQVNKCEASVRGLIYGRVKVTPTLVEFFPETYRIPPPPKREGEQEPKAAAAPAVIRYVPVEWRGERLLVEENSMDDFGDYLSGLGEYNGRGTYVSLELTEFLTRMSARADESAEANARASHAPPVVPAGYEKFLKKPVEATVTAVGRRSLKRDYLLELPYNSTQYDRASLTRVTVGAGTAQGVKDKMVFRVTEPDEGEVVIVLRAGENESEAVVVRGLDERGVEMYYDYDKDRERKHSEVAAGWKLTTNPF